MSQEKVLKYKEEKANRKATMKKQKITKIICNSVLAVAFVVLLGWIGHDAVEMYQDNKPRKAVEVDYAALNEYTEGLSAE